MKNYLYFIAGLLVTVNSLAQTHLLKPKDIFDFAGYANPDPNKPQNWFDSYPNVDPLHGNTSWHGINWDTTHGGPFKLYGQYMRDSASDSHGVHHPGHTGAVEILDMTGARGLRDTTKKVVFTDIYVQNGNFDTGDTMFFYNADKILRHTVNRWAYIARMDSLLTPFAYIVSTATPGQFLHVAVSDSMRFLAIRFNIGSNGKIPDFDEIFLYGTRSYDSTAGTYYQPMYTGPLPKGDQTKRTFDQMVYSNEGQGYDTSYITMFGGMRVYWDKNYQDTTQAQTYTNFRFRSFPDVGTAQLGYFNVRHNKIMWFTMQGGSQYSYNNGHGNLNIDVNNHEPSDSAAYKRNYDLFYNYAAKFGSVAVSSGLTKWVGDGGFPNGLGLMKYMETGNEEEGYNITYQDSYMQTMAAYKGIKAADPSIKVMMPGMVDIDSNKVKTWILCAAWLNHDSLPFDIVNYHRYWSNRDRSNLGITFNTDVQVGQHSVGPEFEDFIPQTDSFARRIYKYNDLLDTTHEIWLTENGPGNYGTPAANVGQAGAVWDIYCSPSVGSWDSLQYKAIKLGRSYVSAMFTPLAHYANYEFHNVYGDTVNHYNLFASSGWVAGYTGGGTPYLPTKFFPAYYYMGGMMNRLTGWIRGDTISRGDTSGLWHVTLRKLGRPDSVCHIIWKGSESGSTLSSQSITVGAVVGGSLQKAVFSFTGFAPTTNTVTPTGTTLSVGTVSEIQQFFFAQELPIQTLWIFKHPAVFKSN